MGRNFGQPAISDAVKVPALRLLRGLLPR